ncbi:DNA mismatch repair endonuclease MutL [bacterium]|nr:DNA mismatch repair endonuclease MutL [bacterium]
MMASQDISTKISLLSSEVANLIAAGEVVERPASVVKELVENAVDAKAEIITVELKEAGMKMIRVTDDGDGMVPEDAVLAFSRHATSKIKAAQDLEKINTFGFRGEALPSIASVSRIEMKTSTRLQEIGLQLNLEGGCVILEKPVACTVGTDLIVQDLFFNTPARKHFMKSKNTEQTHAIQAVELAALANPEIRFRLLVDQRELFHCPKTKKMQERLYAVYGKSLPREMLDIEGEAGGIWMRGSIGGVGDHKNTRQGMRFFINQRPVDHRGIAHAVIQAYRTLIPEGRFPVTFLFFEMPGHLVDVNVHPAKREVRLRDEKAIHDFVYRTLREKLKTGDLSGGRVLDLVNETGPAHSSRYSHTNESLKLGWSAGKVKESVATYLHRHPKTQGDDFTKLPEKTHKEPSPGDDSQELRIIGQVGKTYIAAQDQVGFMLIDQHAAHERILYEKFLEADSVFPRQSLLLPLTFECSASQTAILENYLDFFSELGLEISVFGKNTFTIQTQPAALPAANLIKLVKEVLDGILETGRKQSRESLREKTLHQMACKAAVKAGERMQAETMHHLVSQALALPGLPTCPHGRPFLFRLKWNELDKIFKRDYA